MGSTSIAKQGEVLFPERVRRASLHHFGLMCKYTDSPKEDNLDGFIKIMNTS